MDQPDAEDLLYKKYLRVGHIDEGRLCDRLAKVAATLLHGELLPARWKMLPPDLFTQEYGSGSFWSKTQQYHLFIHNGVPIFRIWTRTKADYAWVDVSSSVVSILKNHVDIEPIPEGNLVKCKPHTMRFKARTGEDIGSLVAAVRYKYGLES